MIRYKIISAADFWLDGQQVNVFLFSRVLPRRYLAIINTNIRHPFLQLVVREQKLQVVRHKARANRSLYFRWLPTDGVPSHTRHVSPINSANLWRRWAAFDLIRLHTRPHAVMLSEHDYQGWSFGVPHSQFSLSVSSAGSSASRYHDTFETTTSALTNHAALSRPVPTSTPRCSCRLSPIIKSYIWPSRH